MTAQDINEFLSKPNNMVVATSRLSGGAQLTPVWFLWYNGSFYFSTTKDRAKYKNIVSDPSISVIVDDSSGFQYVAAYGEASVMEDAPDDIVHKLVEKYVSGNTRKEWEERFKESNRVIIKLNPEKILTN